MKPKSFSGGILLDPAKGATEKKPIQRITPPKKVVLPLLQHTGAALEPLVKKGDQVRRGQKIADAEAFVTAPVHASVSGKVAGVEEWWHPVLGRFRAVVIENDFQELLEVREPLPEDIESLDPVFLREWIREGGMVGLGGAAFPTHVKVSPPPGKKIDSLIVNGAECEPYLTCDHRVMLERTELVLWGVRILARSCGAGRVYVGIEENKEDCIERFEKLRKDFPLPLAVVKLPTRYPQGSEKQLIKAILGREVPPGGLPLDVGVVVNNVQTAWAVGRMAREGIPLLERVITMGGDCLKEPGNIEVPLGTLLEEVVAFCGGLVKEPRKIIMGGPMTGIAQVSLEVPVVKGSSGFLFFSQIPTKREYPCIRCGRCVEGCPMFLVPSDLAKLSEFKALEEAEKNRILDCMECGCCSYVCPAGIEIVQRIKLAKGEILRRRRKGGVKN